MTDTWQTIAQRLRTEAPDRGLMLKGAIVIEALAEELAASPASPPAEALPSQTSEVDEAGACCDGYEAQIAVLQQVIKDRDATIAALAKPASEPAGGDVLLELHRLRRLEEARSQQPDWEKLWAEQTEKLETSEEANSSLRDVLASIAIPEGQHFLSQTEAATQGIEQYWAYERGCEHALAMVASRAGAALSSPASSSPAEKPNKIMQGLRDAVEGNWASVVIGGQRWAPVPAEAEALQAGVEAVRIKALEWDDATSVLVGQDVYFSRSTTPFSSYRTEQRIAGRWWMTGPDGEALRDDAGAIANFATLDEAKAAAQIDYAARIRSALSSAPAQEDGSKDLSAHPRGSGQSAGSVEAAARVLYAAFEKPEDMPQAARRAAFDGYFFTALRLLIDPAADVRQPLTLSALDDQKRGLADANQNQIDEAEHG